MGAYRTVIGYNPKQFDSVDDGGLLTTPTKYLILDTQKPKQVNVSATLAQQPLINGDTMSDHMYRNPKTISISGSFSLNGKNWDDDTYNFNQEGDRLTNIQSVFERISDEGFLCQLITIREETGLEPEKIGQDVNNAQNRFVVRNNMALNRITWSEEQNTMQFTFEFTEVIMVDTQKEEPLSLEEREKLGLPSVSNPQGSSLGTLLIQTGQFRALVIQALYERGYMDENFIVDALKIVETGFRAATGGGLKEAATALGIIGASAGVGALIGSAIPGIGTAAGAVIGVVISVVVYIVKGIVSLIDKKKEHAKKSKIMFMLKNGSSEEDLHKLENLLDDLEIAVNKIKSKLTIFTINGDKDQNVILNIGGEYYKITFSSYYTNPDVTGKEWTAKITDLKNKPLDTVARTFPVVTNITTLNRNNNLWFKDKSKVYEAYLVNMAMANGTDKAKENLENYSIWVSAGPIQDEINKVYDAINNALMEQGFE